MPAQPGTLPAYAKCVLDWHHFEAFPSPQKLDFLIAETQNVLSVSQKDPVATAALLEVLSDQMQFRFRVSQDRSDLDAAIDAIKKAIASVATDDPKRSSYFSRLGLWYYVMYWVVTGARADIEAAIQAATEAIQHEKFGDVGNLAGHLVNLSNWIAERYKLTGQISDLDAAIKAADDALSTLPPEHAHRAGLLNNPGRLYYMRYLVTGKRADLDASIAASREGLAVSGEADTLHYTNLSNALAERANLTGSLEDRNESISAARAAIELMPAESGDHAMLQNNLGNRYSDRFHDTGSREDLDAAIAEAQRSIVLARETQADRAMFLDNLGNRLLERSHITKALEDLEASIRAAEQAVGLTPQEHVGRPIFLANLAQKLVSRFEERHTLADLDEAISISELALSMFPAGSPEAPKYLFNLGSYLLTRHQTTRQERDISAAVGVLQRAIKSLHEHARDSGEAKRVVSLASQCTRSLLGALTISGDTAALILALELGKGVRLRADLARSHRYPSNLNSASRERCAAIQTRLKELGGELGELGRRSDDHAMEVAALRKEQLVLSTERQSLESGDPEFGVDVLDYAGVRALARKTRQAFLYMQPMQQEEDGLLAVIVHAKSSKRRPREDDVFFLRGWHREAVRRLIFRRYDEFYEAFQERDSIQFSSQDDVGWLTALTASKVGKSSALWTKTISSVLIQLGDQVMKPLGKRLLEIGAKRVVLVPGDRLGIIPLHAAPADSRMLPFGELFESSYAPSATSFHHCLRRGPPRRARRVVGLANPDGSLEFSEIELKNIERSFGASCEAAYGPDAKRSWLLERARYGDVVCLSTHAVFAMGQPHLSYFLLAGAGEVTDDQKEKNLLLQDILRGDLTLKPGAIVVADACETGQIAPTDTAEEFVGFPAAFLSSGAGAVVASFWSVGDFSTALLMENVLLRLRVGERPSYALQQATKWLRHLSRTEVLSRLEHELASVELAIADRSGSQGSHAAGPRRSAAALSGVLRRIHQGPDLPFSHPVHWAAFAVHGVNSVSRRSIRRLLQELFTMA